MAITVTDLNPVENLWWDLKKAVSVRKPSNMRELETFANERNGQRYHLSVVKSLWLGIFTFAASYRSKGVFHKVLMTLVLKG